MNPRIPNKVACAPNVSQQSPPLAERIVKDVSAAGGRH